MERENGITYFSGRSDRPWIRKVNGFLRTPWFVLLIGVLTALCSLFSLELPVYTVLIGIMIYVCLLGDDLLALLPVIVLCYVSPSAAQNPGRNEDSVFYPLNGGLILYALVLAFAVCLVIRLVKDPDFGGKGFLKAPRKLQSGMLLLGAAYVLSGLGMEDYFDYFAKNLMFALIEFISVFALYFLATGAVDWKRVPKGYLAWTAVTMGFVVFAQLLQNYLSGRIFMGDTGTIDRELMHTGWGMHNNIGMMMAMCMPFAFYLACRQRRGWIFAALGAVLLGGVIASCSRTSMAVAVVIFAVCMVILLRRAGNKKLFITVCGLVAAALLVGVVLLWDRLMGVFQLFFDELLIISSRDKIYVNGFKQLLTYPIFGGSFFPQTEYVPWDWADIDAFTSLFPPRWHNTWIQLGASCGLVGLAAYAYHRFQTVCLFLKGRSLEKLFIAISLTVLLVTSLLDCHFFNVGPVLFYSAALAFAENLEKTEMD